MDVGADGQRIAWWLGFALALSRFRGPELGRFALALVTGAAAAHLGWLALHADRVPADVSVLADPTRGFSVLFVPLGPWLVGWTAVRATRRRGFLVEALRGLPLALAMARLGCLAAGCCGGVAIEHGAGVFGPTGSWGGGPSTHPTALYEASALLLLHRTLARVPADHVPSCFALGFASIRLAVEPLRAIPPLGAPRLPVEWIAAAWWGAGFAGIARCRHVGDVIRNRRCLRREARRRPASRA